MVDLNKNGRLHFGLNKNDPEREPITARRSYFAPCLEVKCLLQI